jgi:hypothetical protein
MTSPGNLLATANTARVLVLAIWRTAALPVPPTPRKCCTWPLDIETFDPQQSNDIPSYEVFTAIYEGSANTIACVSTRLSPTRRPTACGNRRRQMDGAGDTRHLLHDDPAFGGVELVAADFDHSLKR